jgi:AraC-like DNA-binding protein
MSNKIFGGESYSVSFAERRDVGQEWNNIKWDRNHKEIGCHRLYLLTEGRAEMRLNTGTLELLPGRVYFIPAFSVLQSEIHGKMNKFYIHFRSGSFALGLYRYLSGHYSVPADEISVRLFETVVENYAKNTEDAHLKVQGAMNLLLSDFFAEPYVNHQGIVKFEPVLRYIEENYKNGSLSEAARLLHYDFYWLSHEIKNRTGMTYTEHLQEKRLSQAAFFLKNTSLSVEEVALAVGYENESYFHRIFKEKYGLSPKKFRVSEK